MKRGVIELSFDERGCSPLVDLGSLLDARLVVHGEGDATFELQVALSVEHERHPAFWCLLRVVRGPGSFALPELPT